MISALLASIFFILLVALVLVSLTVLSISIIKFITSCISEKVKGNSCNLPVFCRCL